jgi:propionate catabolism operon transcriptional regulator
VCERLALFLLAEPLQALTRSLLVHAMPELSLPHPPANQLLNDKQTTTPIIEDEAISKQHLHTVVLRFKGNRAAAAAHLGMSRTTLWRKLKEN